ncbi:MAG: bifunctional adenosylcobinamide kinase/adenosylcobinamide-phosphate guanylyltransferase [Thermodesulfobacteriota bacterium]
MAEITLILGGARSGKSSLALRRCAPYPAPRIYLATAEALDPEMAERIRRHQAERGPDWRTVEEPLDPAGRLRGLKTEDASIVLLDCLTLWLSNLLAGRGATVDEAALQTQDLAQAAQAAPCPIVIVSNEVGLGLVPENKLARDFRDAAGLAHQILAARAAEVLFVAAGLALRLK